MKAMVLNKLGSIADNRHPLEMVDMPDPVLQDREILISVSTCGVCHTELDEIEGRSPPPKLPVILGHQVVGRVEAATAGATRFKIGDRVGVAWIHSACGQCSFCLKDRENLCEQFKATGRDLGLTGFGASAHLVLRMVRHKYPNTRVFVFARSKMERDFARQLGAFWAGDTGTEPPEKLDGIIDTTPAWQPVVKALACLKPGGRLVINAIRKEESDKKALGTLDYPNHLWLEKEIKSVANVTRTDVSDFLQLAAEIQIKPQVQEFELEDANRALVELKERKIQGAKVLNIG